jgi:hypothetical protein
MTDAPTPRPAPPSPPRRSGGSVAWPLALIAVGVVVLAANLGWFNAFSLLSLLQYWPVALIAVGVNLLTRGRYVTPIVIAAVVVALALWSADDGLRGLVGPGTAGETVAVEHDLMGAASARVTLDLGVGRVRIDGGAPSGVLAVGTIRTGRGETIEQDYGRENGTALLELRSRQAPGTTFGANERRTWELSLTRDVPLALRVDAGVGETRIDLRETQLIDATYRGGVGESELLFPAGDYDASVDVGVGATTVRLPPEAAARVTVTTGLGRATVQGEWLRDGDVYTTPGYDAASRRIDMRVSGGVGAITVDRR